MDERERYHTPILVDEVLSYLITDTNGVYVDATVGGGGHAAAIAERLETKARLICFDVDPDAVTAARENLRALHVPCEVVHQSYIEMQSALHQRGCEAVNGIVFDLGVSSHQLDQAERGFSFQSDAPLDMRMDKTQRLHAADVINTYNEERLREIFYRYGEERYSKKIASEIVRQRIVGAITGTAQLKSVIERVIGARYLTKTLARIFQAVRIEVNNELANVQQGMETGIKILKPGGRMAVIAFHSLEDRIVKDVFMRAAGRRREDSGHPAIGDDRKEPTIRLLTKKVVVPNAAEESRNPRARSAKLRAIEKI